MCTKNVDHVKPTPDNNEFDAAEKALRNIGSNLWFSGLSDEWQDFLIANTVETFDTYELSLDQAAQRLINFFQKVVSVRPDLLELDPWKELPPPQ